MKRFLLFVFIIFVLPAACGCADVHTPNAGLKASEVRIYDVPTGVDRYDGAEVYLGEERLPVYSVMVNTSQSWSGNNYHRTANGVCMFELDGYARITVKPKTQINYASVVRPLSAKLTPIADIGENTLTITFKSAGEYVLEINGDPHDAVHFFVSAFDADGIDKYSAGEYARVEVFDAGLHTAANDARIDRNNSISLGSNTLVYLADGAVVRGKFVANNAQNITIAGRGVIDGSTFERDAVKGTVTVPLDFNYCKNVRLNDFTVLDPAGWCVNFYFMQDSAIDDIKIITSRSNGDGISLQSCKNITVDGCFVRTWDDSLVVKNYPRWDNRSAHGATDSITFTNCTVWTDLAQSMELGYETVGVPFKDVVFDNITVLHAMHNAAMSIHNANNADIQNVAFRNITIEDGKNAANGAGLIDFRILYSPTWSDQHTSPTALGTVKNVTVQNVNIVSAKKLTGVIGGCYDTRSGFEGERYIDGVTLQNIAVGGKRPSLDESAISVNQYVRGFEFVQDEETQVTGAAFDFTQSPDYLAAYGGECNVTVI